MFFYTFMPKLFNMSLTASVAIVLVILLRLLLKKAPKVISYALWGVVLFRLLCPVSIESGLSLYNLFDAPTEESGTMTSVIEYVPSNIVHTENPSVALPVPGVSDVINEALPQGEEQLRADPLEGPIFIATYVWMAGVLTMVVYSAISYIRLRRKLSVVVPLRDNIFIADDIKSPFVVGLFRPKIYLPCNLGEKEQEYIILHEQNHIRRLDHVVKALAFLALAIHWFNPLVWVAFILASKDMEMSCDEAVIRKIGSDVRADYSASLLTLATGRRIIAGTPLAFGEGDTKGRINNLSKWKKPAVWVVLLAVVACVILAISLLTNPSAKREFPINGSNVSELNTEQVVGMIARAEKLDDGSQLCVNENAFDLMFTSDFEWANDGAIQFFYLKDQKTYSAQLRMFHGDNKYFITDSSEWIEQEQFFKLFHYLDALKYMPQEEIRKLSPDADGFSVYMRNDGVPDDYDRVLKYSQNGVEDIDGWYIHLEVQPLHEVEGGAYNGSGDEVIHLFYGHQDLVMLENNSVTKWFDYLDAPDEMEGGLATELPEYPGVTFQYTENQIIASKPFNNADLTGHIILIGGMPIWNAYFTDLTGDGYPDICATYTYGSGMIDSRIVICDYVNGASYELSDRGYHDFTLWLNESDGQLYVDKRVYPNGEVISSGRLVFEDDCIQIIGQEMTNVSIIDIEDPTKAEGFSYDTAMEKFFEDEANEYYFSGIYSQYVIVHYTDGTHEDIVSALNAGRATIADLDRFGIRYTVDSKELETAFEANFGGNTSFGQKMELTADYPYWCIEIENTGNGTVQMELQGEVYRVEAGTTKAFYADEKWEAGTYTVSFSTAGYQPMHGSVICTRSTVPMTDSQTTSAPTYTPKGVSGNNVKELSRISGEFESQGGLPFVNLSPGEEAVSSSVITFEENGSVMLFITWGAQDLFLEFGIRAEDGTEYFQEKQGGSSILLIEDIPAGTYHLYVKNSDAYSGIPAYENPDEFDGVSFDATGAMNYRVQ